MTTEERSRSAISLARRQVPRYLFRVYSEGSGKFPYQNPTKGLNGKKHITPHAFLHNNNKLPPPFHKILPQEIAENATGHYEGRSNWSGLPYESLFSSWTPSLLLALCYARAKHERGQQDVCICMIDSSALDNEIANADALVDWDELVREWIPSQRDIMEERAESLEYMVFGSICRTPVLRVVSYKDIMGTGLAQILPDWTSKDFHDDAFGYDIRDAWFGKAATEWPRQNVGLPVSDPDRSEINIAMAIGNLYGGAYALPVATAVLSLRPRPWAEGTPVPSWEDAVALFRHSKALKRLLTLAANCSLLPVNLRSDGISFEEHPDQHYSPEVEQHRMLLKIIWRALYPTLKAPKPGRNVTCAVLRARMRADDRWQDVHLRTGRYDVTAVLQPTKRKAEEASSSDDARAKKIKREN